jgi:hypothetical protein
MCVSLHSARSAPGSDHERASRQFSMPAKLDLVTMCFEIQAKGLAHRSMSRALSASDHL